MVPFAELAHLTFSSKLSNSSAASQSGFASKSSDNFQSRSLPFQRCVHACRQAFRSNSALVRLLKPIPVLTNHPDFVACSRARIAACGVSRAVVIEVGRKDICSRLFGFEEIGIDELNRFRRRTCASDGSMASVEKRSLPVGCFSSSG